MQRMQEVNAELHAFCATEKAALEKGLLEISALCFKNAAQKNGIEELMRHLAKEPSARKGALRIRGTRRTPWLRNRI